MTMAGDRETPYPSRRFSTRIIGVFNTHLLAMNKDISTTSECASDVLARAFEMRF